MVSLAPGMIIGYIANYFNNNNYDNYQWICDSSFQSNYNTFCLNGICCQIVQTQRDLFEIVPKIASSALATWGIVKAIGFFISKYDADIVEKKLKV